MVDGASYLDEVERGLPFDDRERRQVLDELRGHIEDTAAAIEDSGVSRVAAIRVALDRLGPAPRLARELTAARQ